MPVYGPMRKNTITALRAKQDHLFAGLVYFGVSVLLFYRPHANGDIFVPSPDVFSFIWFLHWWPYALSHNLNPFVSDFVWAPQGVNLMWSTSIPALALIFWPVTHLWGPVCTWNLLSIITPAFNGLACYTLLRVISCKSLPSICGGLVFGFSPYIAGQLMGHLNLSFIALVPLLVAIAIMRARRAIHRRVYISLAALLLILQFGISNEILASAVLVGLFAFAAFYLAYRNCFDFFGLAFDSCLAALAAVVILSPALYFLYEGLRQLPPVINSPEVFSADLLNFVIPTPVTWLGHEVFANITGRFTGNFSEEGAYLGLPMLLLIITAIYQNRERQWLPPLALIILCTSLLSLGPHLWINGYDTKLLLPWQIFLHLPLIRHALPVRFTMYTALAASVFVAMWLSQVKTISTGGLNRYGFALLSLTFLVPNHHIYSWAAVPTLAALPKKAGNELFGHRPNLVVLPYGEQGSSMLWQVRSGMSFTMAGGYVGITPAYFTKFPATSYLYGSFPSDQEIFNNEISAFCGLNHVDGIVMTPGTNVILAKALAALPWPHMALGASTLLKVPADPSYLVVTGDFWGWADHTTSPAWIGREAVLHNHTAQTHLFRLALEYTPDAITPVTITTQNGTSLERHVIPAAGEILTIPPHATVVLHADKTWVPDHYLHNGDKRSLSVTIQRLE
jgi:hypothetical protein